MVTGSRELIREMNRRLVLETVINDGPLSRAAISKKLGLTKATISAIVQDLLEEQYIEEIGSDQTQYGRNRSCYNSAVRTVILSLWISVWNVPC